MYNFIFVQRELWTFCMKSSYLTYRVISKFNSPFLSIWFDELELVILRNPIYGT